MPYIVIRLLSLDLGVANLFIALSYWLLFVSIVVLLTAPLAVNLGEVMLALKGRFDLWF